MHLKAVKTFPQQQNLQNACASRSYGLFQRKEDVTQAKKGDFCLLFFCFNLAMRVFSVCFFIFF